MPLRHRRATFRQVTYPTTITTCTTYTTFKSPVASKSLIQIIKDPLKLQALQQHFRKEHLPEYYEPY
jgi:hypothetical protein